MTQTLKSKCKTTPALKYEAYSVSMMNLGRPIIASTVFDQAFITILDRVGPGTPGLTTFGGYWISGKFKKFSAKQLIAYQNQQYACDR